LRSVLVRRHETPGQAIAARRYCCGSSGGKTCQVCHVGSGISPAVIFESGTQKSSSSPGRKFVIRVVLPLSWIVAPALGLKLKVVFMAPALFGSATRAAQRLRSLSQ
jgi:hypothetical protein